MKWKLEQMPELNGCTIEWAEPGRHYFSRRERIFHSTDLRPPFTEIGRIDAPSWKAFAGRLRLGQRLLRFMVYNLVPLPNGDIFITFDKTVGVIRDGRYRSIEGLARPCRVLRFGCSADSSGNVFFGEYLANNERGEMKIYRLPAGGERLEVAYVFPAGSIKHIHGLYFDRFTNSIFCLTGDDDSECQILRTDDGFETVEIIGSGDESWRAVSLLFDERNIYYGTDAEYMDNRILQLNRRTLERRTLGEVTGTVFYSKRIGNDMFFTTTAENAPSQIENVAALWHVGADGKCEKLASFEKDRWHPTLFMFGTIHFPYSNAFEDRLYFSLVGVKGDDQTFCLYLENES